MTELSAESLTFRTESVRYLYQECAANYRYYLDWRFKLFTRLAVAFGATLLVAKYIFEKAPEYLGLLPVPLLLFGFLSLIFLQIERRHEHLTHEAAKIAAQHEIALLAQMPTPSRNDNELGGFYYFQANKRPILTHSMMFRLVYEISAVLGFVAAGIAWTLLR